MALPEIPQYPTLKMKRGDTFLFPFYVWEDKEANKKLAELGDDSDSDSESGLGDIFQVLVSNGHRWADIKNYSYGELGVFFRAIRLREQNLQYISGTLQWLSHHDRKGEGFKKVLDDSFTIKKKQPKAKQPKGNNDVEDFIKLMTGLNSGSL